jgi:hypothetical protein
MTHPFPTSPTGPGKGLQAVPGPPSSHMSFMSLIVVTAGADVSGKRRQDDHLLTLRQLEELETCPKHFKLGTTRGKGMPLHTHDTSPRSRRQIGPCESCQQTVGIQRHQNIFLCPPPSQLGLSPPLSGNVGSSLLSRSPATLAWFSARPQSRWRRTAGAPLPSGQSG